jgi:hypothetical protein
MKDTNCFSILHKQPSVSSYTFNDSINAGKATRLSDSLNISISQAGLETLTMSESKKDQLKAAFLLFCKREFVSHTVILNLIYLY